MVYYLGKDVKVYITTETNEAGVSTANVANKVTIEAGSDATTHFAHKLHVDSIAGAPSVGNHVSDLTGVDIGIGVQDEDISYIGRMNVLKAEIKKETTVSLTRKKSGSEWDTIYCGPINNTHEYDDGELEHGARWGIAYRASGGGAGTTNLISNGLISPSDHKESTGTDITFGYRVHVQLKSGGQWLSIPGCQVTEHTVSINGDGTSEETIGFSTHVDLKIGATAGDVTVLTASDM